MYVVDGLFSAGVDFLDDAFEPLDGAIRHTVLDAKPLTGIVCLDGRNCRWRWGRLRCRHRRLANRQRRVVRLSWDRVHSRGWWQGVAYELNLVQRAHVLRVHDFARIEAAHDVGRSFSAKPFAHRRSVSIETAMRASIVTFLIFNDLASEDEDGMFGMVVLVTVKK